MARHARPKRPAARLPSVGEVYTLAKQLDKELQDCMQGTAEEREELFSTAGPNLTELHAIIKLFTLCSDERDRAICYLPKTIYNIPLRQFLEVDGPPEVLPRPARLAIALAESLIPYLLLTCTVQDRDRLSNACGRVFFDAHIHLELLTEPDR